MTYTKIDELIGQIFVSVTVNEDKSEMVMVSSTGDKYIFEHHQGCCESVEIEDICGDLSDLENSPILSAEESESDNINPDGVPIPEYQDSFTWTFYKFSTIKGFVTVRWYGSSNGYYSESVSLDKVAA